MSILVCVFSVTVLATAQFQLSPELSRSLDMHIARLADPESAGAYLRRQCGVIAHLEAAELAYLVRR